MAKIMATEMIAGGGWIQLNRSYYYLDLNGRMRTWEFASRRNSNGVVTMIPVIKDKRAVIVIKQFRVPTGAYTWEFPAGLINKGETPAEAAIRELKEETGYTGEVFSISPMLYNSPGMSSEAGHLVSMVVDLANQADTETHFDESEDITTQIIPFDKLQPFLYQSHVKGEAIDGKLYMWAMAHLN